MKAKSKILLLGFLTLFILGGLLGSARQASAQADLVGTCRIGVFTKNERTNTTTYSSYDQRTKKGNCVAPERETSGETTTRYGVTGWSDGSTGYCFAIGNIDSSFLSQWGWSIINVVLPENLEVDIPSGTNIYKEYPNLENIDCSYEELSKKYGDVPSPEDGVNYVWSKAKTKASEEAKEAGGEAFEQYLASKSCILNPIAKGGTWEGCFLGISYVLFYSLPSFILYISAYFFNVLISVTLSSKLFAESEFIKTAWGIVRDFSNLFFILILLYISIKIILDIGAADAKKMIAKVVMIALLINFSMFFTGIVVDSSNILALVFYNKLNVETKNADGSVRNYEKVSGERDVAGAMVNRFDPTKMLSEDFIKTAGGLSVLGTGEKVQGGEASTLMLIGIIVMSGILMFFAAYCFFVAGFAFVGRLVELWILIIASPFAFMSYVVPKMAEIPNWGWKSWLHRLLTSSFMAAAFMFFLYFIFLLLDSNIFADISPTANSSFIQRIIEITLPAILVLILLLKSLKLAKMAAGQMGETVTKWGEKLGGAAGGLALGAATGGAGLAIGGTAALGRATAGRAGAAFAGSKLAKEWEARGWGGGFVRQGAEKIGAASFDVRGAKIGGQTLAGATGLDLGKAKEGGFTEARKQQIEKRRKRAESLEVGEDEGLKQALNQLEIDKQSILREMSHDLEQLDNRIKVWRERVKDRNDRVRVLNSDPRATQAEKDAAAAEAREAADNLKDLNDHKKALKDGVDYTTRTAAGTLHGAVGGTQNYGTRARVGGVATGYSINELEDEHIPDAHHAIETENRNRKWRYADTTEGGLQQTWDFATSLGQHSPRGAREAAHNIRMEAKIEDKGGKH